MGFDLTVPLVAFAVAAALILVMRWVFRPSRPRTGRPEHGPGADLGMLRPVLSETGRAVAFEARRRLAAAGIRCSVSRVDRDSYDVLVFEVDLQRARTLLTELG
jgi:hypothetical protein